MLFKKLPQLEHLLVVLKHDVDLVDLEHNLLSLLLRQVLQNLLKALVREDVLPVLGVEHELAEYQLVGLLAVLEHAVKLLLQVDELVARPMGHPLVEIGDLEGVSEQVPRQPRQEPEIVAHANEVFRILYSCYERFRRLLRFGRRVFLF